MSLGSYYGSLPPRKPSNTHYILNSITPSAFSSNIEFLPLKNPFNHIPEAQTPHHPRKKQQQKNKAPRNPRPVPLPCLQIITENPSSPRDFHPSQNAYEKKKAMRRGENHALIKHPPQAPIPIAISVGFPKTQISQLDNSTG